MKTLLLFVRAFALSLLLSVVCACEKDSTSNIYRTADAIVGNYELSAIYWEGNPIDVNNDGIANNELYDELLSLSTNSQDHFDSVVMDFSNDRAYGLIGMALPTQCVCVTADGQYPKGFMTGDNLPVSLSYWINDDGSIITERFESFETDEFERRVELRNIHDGTVVFDLCGHMTFSVMYTIYDHKTDGLVDGKMHYTFDRK